MLNILSTSYPESRHASAAPRCAPSSAPGHDDIAEEVSKVPAKSKRIQHICKIAIPSSLSLNSAAHQATSD